MILRWRIFGQRTIRWLLRHPGGALEGILELSPHLVISDALDTTAEDICRMRASGAAVVTFEDMGEGARHADLVINDLYPAPEHTEGRVLRDPTTSICGPSLPMCQNAHTHQK